MITTAQQTTLRTAIFADPVAAPLQAAGNAQGLKSYLNGLSAFIVYRTAVSQDEIMLNDFDWSRVDNLSIGKARIWEWMFSNQNKSIDPSKPNIRAGIDATWVGTAADLAVRAAVYTHCKRAATQAERMLATGTGTDATPGDATWSGTLADSEVSGLIWNDNGTIRTTP